MNILLSSEYWHFHRWGIINDINVLMPEGHTVIHFEFMKHDRNSETLLRQDYKKDKWLDNSPRV